ncbi:MAG: sulfur carrier protein ThiS [Candidatus Margulisiibacteriota bacterium]
MKVTINGKQEDIASGLSISGLLAEKKVQMPEMVSVERNGEILSRDTFATTMVTENDTIEFLYFMGGGTW